MMRDIWYSSLLCNWIHSEIPVLCIQLTEGSKFIFKIDPHNGIPILCINCKLNVSYSTFGTIEQIISDVSTEKQHKIGH